MRSLRANLSLVRREGAGARTRRTILIVFLCVLAFASLQSNREVAADEDGDNQSSESGRRFREVHILPLQPTTAPPIEYSKGTLKRAVTPHRPEDPQKVADAPIPRPCVFPRGYQLNVPGEAAASAAVSLAQMLSSESTAEYAEDFVSIDAPPDASPRKDCVVYTVFVGTYEKTLKPFAEQTRDCYWIAFTDREHLAGAPGWLVRPIPAHLTRSHNATAPSGTAMFRNSWHRGYAITKYVKMLPFLLFPSFIKYAIYIDGDFHVINSMTIERAINRIAETDAPIVFRRHTRNSNILEELRQCSGRYKAVGTLDILVKTFLAHVAEGWCDHWYDAQAEGNTFLAPDSAELLAEVLQMTYCFDASAETNATSLAMARQFLLERPHHNGSLSRFACRREPSQLTALPRLSHDVLKSIPESVGPHVALYDCSMIGYRLGHPNATLRRFSEEFLKQWHRDSSIHGKDQIPLIMLLWRTPGYFPPLLGDEFRTYGSNLLWKNDHGK